MNTSCFKQIKCLKQKKESIHVWSNRKKRVQKNTKKGVTPLFYTHVNISFTNYKQGGESFVFERLQIYIGFFNVFRLLAAIKKRRRSKNLIDLTFVPLFFVWLAGFNSSITRGGKSFSWKDTHFLNLYRFFRFSFFFEKFPADCPIIS